MFQALFNSLSGLFSFSRSLNTISNNVSNMNTPGFHGSDSFFSNVAGGRGVRIAGEGLRTQSGDLRQTGNVTDVAVEGSGYFILRDEAGNLHYTRAGQFRFDDKGMLVDSVTNYQVMAFDTTGALNPIDLDAYRTLAAQATTSVRIQGNILPTVATTPATTNNIVVYDSVGGTHALSVSFVAVPPATGTTPTGTYNVTITNETGATVGTGQIQFDTNTGMLAAGSATTITANLPIGAGQAITFNFGTPGVPTGGVTSFTGVGASLGSRVENGHGVLGITEMKFDERGILQFTYSSTEHRSGPQLALAIFPNEASLRLDGGRMISGTAVSERTIGRPTDSEFGRIAGGSLEMSNVDLTQEFADMIIVQRGYQASSRVMTVSNEMLEQLYNSTRGG